ncbi:MAG: GNAT family N-acetyltransferase [Anaerolineae bacterium]|nr:GNAT family N-acetyltransferase [Anaerolineae bacterium]
MEIRLATLADAEIISALNVDVQNVHAEALPHIFKHISDPGFAVTYITEQLNDPNNYFYIANIDGEDAGYIFAHVVRRPENAYMHPWNYVYINQISVKPAYQRHGCGTALIQAVRELAKEQGITTVAVDTWFFNEKAQTFFASQGLTMFNQRMWTEV